MSTLLWLKTTTLAADGHRLRIQLFVPLEKLDSAF
jgi:hypothetical protein